MRLSIATLALLGCSLFASDAMAAKPADVAQVVALMKEHPSARPNTGEVTVEFKSGDKHYILWNKGNILEVWMRNGGKKTLHTFSDNNLDGTVDYGNITEKSQRKGECEVSMKQFVAEKKEGEKFQPYWQDLYDQAIIDVLRRLETKQQRFERNIGKTVDAINAEQHAHK